MNVRNAFLLSAVVKEKLRERNEELRSLSIRDVSQLVDPYPMPLSSKDVDYDVPPTLSGDNVLSNNKNKSMRNATINEKTATNVKLGGTSTLVKENKILDSNYQIMSELNDDGMDKATDDVSHTARLRENHPYDSTVPPQVVLHKRKPLRFESNFYENYEMMGGYDIDSSIEDDEDAKSSSVSFLNSDKLKPRLKEADALGRNSEKLNCDGRWCGLEHEDIAGLSDVRPSDHYGNIKSKRSKSLALAPRAKLNSDMAIIEMFKDTAELERLYFHENTLRTRNRMMADTVLHRTTESMTASRRRVATNSIVKHKSSSNKGRSIPRSYKSTAKMSFFSQKPRIIESNQSKETLFYSKPEKYNSNTQKNTSQHIKSQRLSTYTSYPLFSRTITLLPKTPYRSLQFHTHHNPTKDKNEATSQKHLHRKFSSKIRSKRQTSDVMFLAPMYGGIWTLCVDLTGMRSIYK